MSVSYQSRDWLGISSWQSVKRQLCNNLCSSGVCMCVTGCRPGQESQKIFKAQMSMDHDVVRTKV